MLKFIILLTIRTLLPLLIMSVGGMLTLFLLDGFEMPVPILLIATTIGGGAFFYVIVYKLL